jgi:hypothetical protein
MANVQGKSLPVAIGMNLVLPGAGYMYLGRVILGLAAFLLIAGMSVSSPLLMLIPTWLGMNLVMAIDMVILFNRGKSADEAGATYPCPYCAERIQKAATICRFCKSSVNPVDDAAATDVYTQPVGSSLRTVGVVLAAVVVIAVIGIAGVVFVTNDGLPAFTTASPEPPIEVSPVELVSLYVKNEVAADQRFKGKMVAVSGRVSSIGKDLLDNPYVTLDTGVESTFRELQCSLASGAIAEATKLTPGDRVTMRGKVLGLMGHVQLDGCTFAKAAPTKLTKAPRPDPATTVPVTQPETTPVAEDSVVDPPVDAWLPLSAPAQSGTGWIRFFGTGGDQITSINEIAFEKGERVSVAFHETVGNTTVFSVVKPRLFLTTALRTVGECRWLSMAIDGNEMFIRIFDSFDAPRQDLRGDFCGEGCLGVFSYRLQ